MTRIFFIALGLLLSIPSVGQKIRWDKTSVDFGKVEDWNSPVAEFTFTNTGNKEAFFLPQHYQRDVEVLQPVYPIKPGETGAIKVRYYTKETGNFKRKVSIYHGGSQKAEVLTVSGNIRSLYVDALTACPRFGSQQKEPKGQRNVVVAIDRETGDPIKGVRLVLEKNGRERSDTHTGPHGRSTTRIETGRYTIFAEKEGYQNTNVDMIFKEGHSVHWIYMDPISKGRDREREIAIQQENVATAEDLGIGMNDQWSEEESVTKDAPLVKAEPTVVPDPPSTPNTPVRDPYEDRYAYSEQRIKDLEARIEELQYMTDGADLGLSEDRYAEVETEPISEPEPTAEADLKIEDMGVGLNDQWEEMETPIATEPVTEIEERPEPVRQPEDLEREVEQLLAESDRPATEPDVVEEVEPVVDPIPAPMPAQEFAEESYRRNNLVLLLDVSASMRKNDKMVKLKTTVNRLIGMLRDVDVLTIITYNTRSYNILPATPVEDNAAIIGMIDTLSAFGFTNGVKGMNSAYDALKEEWLEGGNNQLILATDGKFNSSKFSEKEAVQMVKDNSAMGRGLSIIGFGEDKDATRMMKKMAKYGNGSFLLINEGEDPTELLADEIKLRSRIE